jgi:hypothetical protein
MSRMLAETGLYLAINISLSSCLCLYHIQLEDSMIHEFELNDNLDSCLHCSILVMANGEIKAVEPVASVQGAAGLYTQTSPGPTYETCSQICSATQRSDQQAPPAFSFEVYSHQQNPITARPNHDPALPCDYGMRWMGLCYLIYKSFEPLLPSSWSNLRR